MQTSPKVVLFREAWRQAFREGELVLQFSRSSEAQRTRMALYNAIQPYKNGEKGDDPELERAAQMVEIAWLDEGKTKFVLRSASKSPGVSVVAAALGTTLETVRSAGEAESERRAAGMMEELGVLGNMPVAKDNTPGEGIPFGTTKNKFFP